MKEIYIVSKGLIKKYKINKEEECFYGVVIDGQKIKVSKEGWHLPAQYGGHTIVTKELIKAIMSAQAQINVIRYYLELDFKQINETERLLEAFEDEHTDTEKYLA